VGIELGQEKRIFDLRLLFYDFRNIFQLEMDCLNYHIRHFRTFKLAIESVTSVLNRLLLYDISIGNGLFKLPYKTF